MGWTSSFPEIMETWCADAFEMTCRGFLYMYRKNPKISDTRKFVVITLKVEQDGFSLE